MYKLKSGTPDFQVTDGPFAGLTYQRGEIYADIPPQERHRFEAVPPIPSKEKTK